MKRMDIYECCRKAIEDDAHNTATFILKNQTGRQIECVWLDAYFGMFLIKGEEGFITCKDVPEDLWVEDYSSEVVTHETLHKGAVHRRPYQ